MHTEIMYIEIMSVKFGIRFTQRKLCDCQESYFEFQFFCVFRDYVQSKKEYK